MTDFNALMVLVLRQLAEEFTQKFMLVIDSLHATDRNSVPPGLLSRLQFYLPSGAKYVVVVLLGKQKITLMLFIFQVTFLTDVRCADPM